MKILNYLSFIFSSIIFLFIRSQKLKYDLIFVYAPSPVIHSLIGVYLKKIKKIPMIVWLQDLWPVSLESSGQIKNKLLIKFIQNLVNYIYSKVDLMLIQSMAYKKHLKGKISNSKVFYIPNAFRDHKKQILKKTNKNFNIFYCGNIGKVQEFNSIVYAAKEIQKKKLNINFIFFGEGVNKNLLKKKIIENKLKNFFIKDHVSLKKLIKELTYADTLYVSLKNFKELNLTVPSKIQFYMSAGKPILAELSGESAKVIKESRSGMVSFPGNKKLLLNNILKMYKLKKKHKLNNLGKNGYNFYKKNYSLNKVIYQIKKCINQLQY
jgi:glycosyltransferase involved in cell wall biosynthesis